MKVDNRDDGRTLSRRCCVLSALLLACASSLVSATGSDAKMAAPAYDYDDVYHRGTVMSASEMEQLRGGFNVAGMQLDFGAELRTLIDNKVQLVTKLNFTRAGGTRVVSQSFQDPTGTAIRVGPETGIKVTEVTPNGVNLAGLEGFSGVALRDEQSFTAALHNITQNAILSSVISNASGKDIQQTIDVNVHVGNVGALRAAKQRTAILDSLSGIMR